MPIVPRSPTTTGKPTRRLFAEARRREGGRDERASVVYAGVMKRFFARLLVAAAAAWTFGAADAAEGPSKDRAVAGLLCPHAIFASLAEIGRLCALEDDFQRGLGRAVTMFESAILLTAPEKAAELRRTTMQLRFHLEREAADGALCRDERGNDSFRWYKHIRARMKSDDPAFPARVAEGLRVYKPTFGPLGCM